jgi:cyclohexa-1,5-dienecarbonyl-CoA hydratase
MSASPERDARLHVHDEQGGRLRIWRIDAPPGNVLDRQLVAALRAELRATSAARPHALLITAGGPHWSYGASIEEHRPAFIGPFLAEFHALVRDWFAAALPTVVALRGRCLGGGLELALLAQRIVAARDVEIAAPEISLGVFAPGASLLLPPRVGQPFADELLTTGRIARADEALARHLVDEVADDPEAAARAWIERCWLAQSRSALRYATQAARLDLADRVGRLLGPIERLYRGELMATPDALEGVEAFLAKRPPNWSAAPAAPGDAAQPGFWRARWKEGRTGWHRERVQPWLEQQRGALLGAGKAARILVPLCGKSVDLAWLAQQGAAVVGVDVAEEAVEGMRREQGVPLAPKEGVAAPFRGFAAGALEFWLGDFFALDRARHGSFDAAFDRAALVALPRARRRDYARKLGEMLGERGRLLLVGLEFDSPTDSGPPFHVARAEATALFEALGPPRLVGDRSLMEEEGPYWASRHVTDAREYALLFR